MQTMKQLFNILLIIAGILSVTACKKYLDAKPDTALVIPTSVDNLQALLDNNDRMNHNCPSGATASCDDYYLTDADFNALTNQRQKNVYTWAEELYFDIFPNDWSNAYDPIYNTNITLEQLATMEQTPKNQTDWNNVMGSALFYRGKCFLTCADLWAKGYDSSTAATDLGIPLRLNSNFEETSTRGTVKAVYDQIISDLKNAIPYLPANPTHVMRPSKAAAYAVLSRAYLNAQDFTSAGKYADSALQIKSDLIDYNTLSGTAAAPFARFNPEVIMHFVATTSQFTRNRVDSNLYAAYNSNDLRKTLFFAKNTDASYNFKGSYDGVATSLFCGLTTNELYLTRAECFARTGNVSAAIADLNTLLRKRWKTGSFVPYTTLTAPNPLVIILAERRKELILRGNRWADIKRLNIKGAGIVLTRILNGQSITLVPNDNRYALPLPANIIALSGMQQNPR
jgi:tetratricopeptide (TPR) repeat protein